MAVTAINGSLMRLEHRAERIDPSTLVETFVDVGPLFHLLNSGGHQIVYGRRAPARRTLSNTSSPTAGGPATSPSTLTCER